MVEFDTFITDKIMNTKGDIRPAQKYGCFPFTYKEETYRLQVFKILRDDPASKKFLFLGFTDATTGKQTYPTGRYIDLMDNDSNHYVVDFNLAYNPYCAYNPRYTCATPSKENFLSFPVIAGEKKYKNH